MPRLSLSEAHKLSLDFESIQNHGLVDTSRVSLWSAAEYENELNSSLSEHFVAPLGFVLFRYESADVVQIMQLAVKQKGQKDFAKMWSVFEAQLISQGVLRVFLEAKEGSSGEKAYLACGFVRQALRKNYYKDGANAWVMTKNLAA